jgi:pilus assembly protein CpaE
VSSLPDVESTAAPFSVAVVDDDPKLRTRLAMQLGEAARASAYPSLHAVEPLTGSGAGVVLVLGPTVTTPEHFAEITRLTRARSVVAVAVVHELSTEILQQAIRAGVSDVVALGGDPAVLMEAIGRAAEALVTTPAPASAGSAGLTSATNREGGGEGGRARVITVFSTKGGAGKSFVATNLAVLLAKRSSQPVVLVDADLQFGDVAVMLKLTPQHTILEAVQQGDRLDADLLKSLLIRHEPSGLLVLPAPVEPAFADHVGLADMLKVLSVLRTFCSHIVIDTPAYFTDVVLGVLEETDDIVLMAGMDIPNIKNTKIGLQTLRLLNIPASKLKLALNRANSRVKLDIAEVEKTLQMKADCLLPSDIAVPQSINKGTPVVLDAPRSGVTRNLERLADMFPARTTSAAG